MCVSSLQDAKDWCAHCASRVCDSKPSTEAGQAETVWIMTSHSSELSKGREKTEYITSSRAGEETSTDTQSGWIPAEALFIAPPWAARKCPFADQQGKQTNKQTTQNKPSNKQSTTLQTHIPYPNFCQRSCGFKDRRERTALPSRPGEALGVRTQPNCCQAPSVRFPSLKLPGS